ncbi:Os01g0656801 [Oryza sativa Japonica Group]|uniref:Os01g0656801 protein n=1 Tax=Oryza sativa subsp. japonica TaxID=39947 RepID=A0A0P0V651_ORYSJ|nr:Os01g0656801 [Oryza sativa Japonica Group]
MAPRTLSPPAPRGGARARSSLEGRRERTPAAANAEQMRSAAWNDDAIASAPERGRRASLFARDRWPPRISLQSSPRPATIVRMEDDNE